MTHVFFIGLMVFNACLAAHNLHELIHGGTTLDAITLGLSATFFVTIGIWYNDLIRTGSLS